MGLLDDAIREHLELKRRRGADPGEIERLEREALGPVRRPGHEANEMPPDDEPALDITHPEDRPTELWSETSDEPAFADHGAEFARETEDWGASDMADTVLEPDVAPPVRDMPPTPEETPPGRDRAGADEFEEQETVEHDVEDEYADDLGREYPGVDGHTYPAPPESGYSEPQESGHPAPPKQSHPDDPEHEDMLEETPEFLQDTPDHDRLWFEQRPPRDFDFDG
jgi:hypothetical protein